ncbi:hypothetical protein BGW80DRAFT_1328181 [Lactifluus volemus]|nr:hypothetical protein BGW80DRAFT_1328181 [Lactifluus volemus]
MMALLYPIPGTSPSFLIVMSISGGRPLSEAVTSLIAVNRLLHTVLFDIILHRFIFPLLIPPASKPPLAVQVPPIPDNQRHPPLRCSISTQEYFMTLPT